MLRLAALGLSHEANTFVSEIVDLARFESVGVLRGAQIVEKHAGGTSTMSGYLAAAADGVEVVPLVFTTMIPSGVISDDALEALAEELVTALAENGPFDGVLAALHGAAVAESELDVDGYLLGRFREVVGDGVPIGVALDLHANISARMCEHADVLNTYRTNPHIDARERAEEVAGLVVRAARGEISPTMAFEPVPVVVNILCQNTSEPPMSDLMAEALAVAGSPGVLSATVAEGFPYADVPEMGMSVVVVTDGDGELASRHARALAEKVWARRDEYDKSALSPVEALAQVKGRRDGPVLLLDVGDNVAGGTPGDSVVLLHAAREVGVEDVVMVVADPEAVACCEAAGTGARVNLALGGWSSPAVGPPVEATARVLALHHGRYEATEAVHAGMRHFDAGPTAAVLLDSGQTVVLTSRPVMAISPANVTSVGLDPSDYAAVVAKGVHSPLQGYAGHVAYALQVDTPGSSSADLSRLPYRRRSRPVHPFEQDARYPFHGA